jgi:hypothetical protein
MISSRAPLEPIELYRMVTIRWQLAVQNGPSWACCLLPIPHLLGIGPALRVCFCRQTNMLHLLAAVREWSGASWHCNARWQ